MEGVNNISGIDIPKDVLFLLSNGINFTPSNPFNLVEMLQQYDDAVDQLCNQFERRNIRTETIKTIRRQADALKIKLANPRHRHRLQDQIKQAMRFCDKNGIIIKNADKNLGLTLMSVKWYDDEIMTSHLSNRQYYRELKERPSHKNIIEQLQQDLRAKNRIGSHDRVWKELIPDENETFIEPEFYIMPKLHKTPISSRPIVPSHSWVTTKASKWLNEQLTPYVNHFPWIQENSLQTIAELQSLEPFKLPENCILAAADVESLYTNIDIDEGIDKVCKLLRETLRVSDVKVNLIKTVLNWVLRNNYFKYKGKYYIQTKGTAMGTSCAPAFANLFLAFYETKWKTAPEWNPLTYHRYLDDVFMALPDDKAGNKSLINFINRTTPSIKFKVELNNHQVPFLDLNIYKGKKWNAQSTLEHRLYEKPTNRHLYTNARTYAPSDWKFSWITGENIRLIRNSTTKEAYLESLTAFKKNLLKRQYPMQIIERRLKHQYEDRPVLLSQGLYNKGAPWPKNQWLIYVKNIPGRHLIEKQLATLMKLVNDDHKEFFDYLGTSTPRIIIQRGRTIFDYCNGNNKKVSLRLEQQDLQSAASVEQTPEDNLDSRDDTIASASNKRLRLEERTGTNDTRLMSQ